jgi:hypothetical protein
MAAKKHYEYDYLNPYRHVRWTGSDMNMFVCDYDNSHHDSLETALARRDHLESDAGKAEIAEKEARREQKRQYDLARDERRARMSAERNEWRLEVCQFFVDGLEVYA